MSEALRPYSLFTSAAPSSAPSGVQGTLPNPPPEITQLPAGTTLRGTVLGSDSKGHLLVRTDLGTLTVATKVPLPPGSEVVLQIRSSGAQLHVLLMHSDTPAGGAAPRAIPLGPGSAGSPPPPPQGSGSPAPDRLALGQTVRAILQSPAPLPAASGSAAAAVAGSAGGGSLDPALAAVLARLAPGSQIAVRILAVEPPAGTPPGTPPGASAGIPLGAAANAAAGTAQAGAVQSGSAGAVSGTAAGTGAGAPAPIPGPAGAPAAAGPGIVAASGHPGASPPAAGAPAGPAAAQSVTPQPGAPQPGAAQPGAPNGVGTVSGVPGQIPVAGGSNPASAPAGAPPAGTGVIGGQPAGSPPPGVQGASAGPLPAVLATGAGAAYGAAAQTSPLPIPHAGASRPGGAPSGAPLVAHAGPAGSAAGTAGAPPIGGTVTATTNAGNPVLQTPMGTLSLDVQARIPVGSRMTFELVQAALPRETAPLPASLARAWPEIEEAVRVLHAATPPGAAPAPGVAAIPQPGAALASGLLFFLAALSGGDLSRWLGGQAVQALKNAGRDSLVVRLGQDFGQLSRHVESGGTDWRLFLIPLLDGSQVQQIRFFERHGSQRDGTGGDRRDGEATRFILEVELSRLGDMQIDGLVRGKRFDLMLRTRQHLPERMRHDITEIFSDANDAAGYIGSIGFQASHDWRFMPVESGRTAGAGAGLVI